jgi:hypothetical protein
MGARRGVERGMGRVSWMWDEHVEERILAGWWESEQGSTSWQAWHCVCSADGMHAWHYHLGDACTSQRFRFLRGFIFLLLLTSGGWLSEIDGTSTGRSPDKKQPAVATDQIATQSQNKRRKESKNTQTSKDKSNRCIYTARKQASSKPGRRSDLLPAVALLCSLPNMGYVNMGRGGVSHHTAVVEY